jgi:hypothetical protein
VGNEENGCPVPDPHRRNSVMSVKSYSKRNSRTSSLRYSWRSSKRRLKRAYKINTKNIKTT